MEEQFEQRLLRPLDVIAKAMLDMPICCYLPLALPLSWSLSVSLQISLFKTLPSLCPSPCPSFSLSLSALSVCLPVSFDQLEGNQSISSGQDEELLPLLPAISLLPAPAPASLVLQPVDFRGSINISQALPCDDVSVI